MSPVPFAALYCLAVLIGSALSSPGPVLASGDQRVAVVPVPQTESWWTERHERALAHVRQGRVDLLFIGDSITQGWEDQGRRVWEAYYGHRHAVNLGFNGDCTEHVLWRLQHGELAGIAPSWRS